jgi:hypothetical protein
MAFKDLPKAEQELVLQCMKALVDGDAIKDWEFHMRLGVPRAQVRKIISQWPDIDDRVEDSDEFLAINNCVNEICHGIRMTPEEWTLRFTHPRDAILQAYDNWLRLGGQTRGGIR